MFDHIDIEAERPVIDEEFASDESGEDSASAPAVSAQPVEFEV